MKSNKTFKDDIETVERRLLIFSWIGILSALGIIGYSIWGIT